jgi:hypothetical protein
LTCGSTSREFTGVICNCGQNVGKIRALGAVEHKSERLWRDSVIVISDAARDDVRVYVGVLIPKHGYVDAVHVERLSQDARCALKVRHERRQHLRVRFVVLNSLSAVDKGVAISSLFCPGDSLGDLDQPNLCHQRH